MSQQTQPPALTQEHAQQAMDVVTGVAMNAFFTKLASAGIRPETEQEAQFLLDMAIRLENAQAVHAKSASVGQLSRADQALREVEAALGLQQPVQPTRHTSDAELRKVARSYLQDSDVKGAMQIAAHLQLNAANGQ